MPRQKKYIEKVIAVNYPDKTPIDFLLVGNTKEVKSVPSGTVVSCRSSKVCWWFLKPNHTTKVEEERDATHSTNGRCTD